MNRRPFIRTILNYGIAIFALAYTLRTLAAFDTQFPLTLDAPFNPSSSIQTSLLSVNHGIGNTKIVGFCNYNYRSVGTKWYERLARLGYTTHVLVATDSKMKTYLESSPTNKYRFEVAFAEPIPPKFDGRRKAKRERIGLLLLFAVRWKYLLSQLEQGTNVLLTDVDNIFSKSMALKDKVEDYDPSIDVWFAYASKYPNEAFVQQGFTVCGGMSWWRASKPAIQLARMIHQSCGIMCDDQRLINNLLLQVNMTWDWTPDVQNSRIIDISDERYAGLPILGMSGKSAVTGHKARIWDRNIAFRGPLHPKECPKNNWVSMPIVDAKSRDKNWIAKLESFDTWDQNCGKS